MTIQTEALEALPYRCVSLCLTGLDEPVFILRAQDILVPKVVVRWVHLAKGAGSPGQSARALVIAKQMADWQAKNQHRVKVAD